MVFLDLLNQGLFQGAIYALMAVGLTMVYGMMGILHIAHAAVFTLGAYCGVIVTNYTGSLAAGLLVAVIVCSATGVAIYRYCYRPILDKPLVVLVLSIGLLIAMQEAFRIVFGPYSYSFSPQPLQAIAVAAGPVALREAELATLIAAVVLIAALAAFATFTRSGLAWRASVSNPQMATSFGIDIERVRTRTFLIASALAGCAGVTVALLNNVVEPTMGNVPGYKALAIIVLGGLGSVNGTLLAAMILGVIESFGSVYFGKLMDRDAIAFGFLVLVLLLRPRGLFAKST
jgi:branched-chain amino acid transport system permease protein